MPGVNRTACGCQLGYSGPWTGMGRPVNQPYALGGKNYFGPPKLGRLGAITQAMAPISPGCAFSLGFQLSAIRNPLLDETAFAGYIEDAGLSYDTSSSRMTGIINPYVVINGTALKYYDTATSFAYDLLNVLQQKNVPIDTSVVNFQAQPFDPNTGTCGAQMVGLPPPPAGSGNNPPATCDWNSMTFGQYVACELGFNDPIKSATTGALIALGAVVVLALVVARR
jgi:hypothetical protein